MSIVPSRKNEVVEFFEAHAPLWATNALPLALSPTQTATITALTADARTKYDAAITARNASRAATQSQDDAINALRDFGADLIKVIRAKAEADKNPGLYVLANIPAPAEPSPLGPPDMPTDVRGFIDTAGSVQLAWRASLVGGTQFTVARQLTPVNGAPGAWTVLGNVAEKSFADNAVPVGNTAASYRVTAVRSGGSSAPSEPATVYFGNLAQAA